MNSHTTRIMFLYGASGHAKVILEMIERTGGWDVAFIADSDPAKDGSRLLNHPVVFDRNDIESRARSAGVDTALVSIGKTSDRLRISRRFRNAGFKMATVMDPSAIFSKSARIGSGSVVMPGATVNADTVIGDDCIINTGVTVDHDCQIGDGAHLAPGVHLCGGVHIGPRVLIGAGSVVIPGCKIGADAVVGAGSTVISDLPEGIRAAGSPCRPI